MRPDISDKTFMHTLDEGDVSYKALIDRTAQIANLLSSTGIMPGDRVAVQIPKCVDAIAIYLGVVRAGAVFLPLNCAYTPHEVSYFLNDANSKSSGSFTGK